MNGQGFTLNELLISLAITAILLLTALPSFQKTLAGWQMQSVQSDLHSSLLMARQAAITRGMPTVVRDIDGDWNNGWQVFVDSNNNTRLDGGDDILFTRTSLPERVHLKSNFGHYARYRRNGRTSYASGAFMAGTWLICAPQLLEYGRKLVMSYGGRLRRSSRTGQSCQ